jgi:hypothetical protein
MCGRAIKPVRRSKLRQADHVHAHVHVNVNVDVVVHVLVTGCLRLIENLSLTTMIVQRSAQSECRSFGPVNAFCDCEMSNSRRQQALNLIRMLYWSRTSGYASSRPERAKEISRGQAERCPRSRTGEETRPGGAPDAALNPPAPLQGARTINPPGCASLASGLISVAPSGAKSPRPMRCV